MSRPWDEHSDGSRLRLCLQQVITRIYQYELCLDHETNTLTAPDCACVCSKSPLTPTSMNYV